MRLAFLLLEPVWVPVRFPQPRRRRPESPLCLCREPPPPRAWEPGQNRPGSRGGTLSPSRWEEGLSSRSHGLRPRLRTTLVAPLLRSPSSARCVYPAPHPHPAPGTPRELPRTLAACGRIGSWDAEAPGCGEGAPLSPGTLSPGQTGSTAPRACRGRAGPALGPVSCEDTAQLRRRPALDAGGPCCAGPGPLHLRLHDSPAPSSTGTVEKNFKETSPASFPAGPAAGPGCAWLALLHSAGPGCAWPAPKSRSQQLIVSILVHKQTAAHVCADTHPTPHMCTRTHRHPCVPGHAHAVPRVSAGPQLAQVVSGPLSDYTGWGGGTLVRRAASRAHTRVTGAWDSRYQVHSKRSGNAVTVVRRAVSPKERCGNPWPRTSECLLFPPLETGSVRMQAG